MKNSMGKAKVRGCILLLLCLSLGYILTQCDKEESKKEDKEENKKEDAVAPQIELEESAYRVGSSEGRLKVPVKSARPDWGARLVHSANWFNIERNTSQDSLIIHYLAQEDAQTRSTTIEITSDTLARSFRLVQRGFNLSFSTSVVLESSGGKEKIRINASDIDWTAALSEDIDWITSVEKNETYDSLIITYGAQKEAGITRRASLNIQLGKVKKELSISQRPVIIGFDPGELRLDAPAGSREVLIMAAGEWSFTKPSDADWITKIDRKADGEGIDITYSANNGTEARRTEIPVSITEATKSLLVIQDQIQINFPSGTHTVLALAGTAMIDISSTGPEWAFTEPSDTDWITQIEKIEQKLHITYKSNAEAESRQVEIPITSGPITRVLTFVQDQVKIYTTKDTYEVSHEAAELRIAVSVSSTSSSWSASEFPDVDWISEVRKEGDELIIVYKEHTARGARQATIRIESEGIIKNITINQKENPIVPEITTPKDTYEVSHEAADLRIAVSAPGDWSASEAPDVDWISEVRKEGNELIIVYKEHTARGTRQATIRIEVGSITKDITINQIENLDLFGPLKLVITPGTDINFPEEGGHQDVNIKFTGAGAENVIWVVTSDLTATVVGTEDKIARIHWHNNSTYKAFNIYTKRLSLHIAGNKGASRTEQFRMVFSARVSYNGVSTNNVIFTISQSSYPEASRPSNMPEGLYNLLGGTRLMVLSPKIFIPRKGPHSNNVTKEEARDLITGYQIKSINPLLLRLGTYIDGEQTQIYYVDIPDEDIGDGLPGRLTVVSAAGNALKKRGSDQDSTVVWYDNYSIFLIKDLTKAFGSASNVLGFTYLGGNQIWLRSGRADTHVLAHEIGHTLDLYHTNQTETCDFDNDRNYLMASNRRGVQLGLIKECENKIVTSRMRRGGKYRGRYLQSHGRVKNWDALGSASTADILEGWRIISEVNADYSTQYPILNGVVDDGTSMSGARQVPFEFECGWTPGAQIRVKIRE